MSKVEFTEERLHMEERFLLRFRRAWNHLISIWDQIGIHGEQREERTNVVMCHLETLLEEMVEEEEGLRKRLLQSVESCGQEMLKLSTELNIPLFEPEENLSILKLESELRNRVETLSKERHERIKSLKRLKEQEQKLCQKLCIAEHVLPQGIPSKEHLCELEQHIKMLKEEKECRQHKFSVLKQNIIKLMERMEHNPETSLERDLVCEDEEEFLLSKENLLAMEALQENLQKKCEETEQICNELYARLRTLWDRVNASEIERKLFVSNYHNPCPSAAKLLKEEIGKFEELKRKNIQKFVEKMRDELIEWWDKCYISEEERKAFTPFYDSDYTENLLDQHDAEIEKMKQIYEKYQELFTKVSKRQQLWNRMLEFEKKASDPNRFNNRGGALLQEEKERKKLLKQLPMLEKELMTHIAEWEKKEGQEFRVFGRNFSNFITEQWEQHQLEKEKEKLERHRQKAKLLEEELACGSRPTPVKRRMGATPNRTPNKCRRLGGQNCTPSYLNSIQAIPISTMVAYSPVSATPKRRSPRLLCSHKKTPMKSTPGKIGTIKREVLVERNENINLGNRKGTPCISPAPSLVSVASYSDFTGWLILCLQTGLQKHEGIFSSTTLQIPMGNFQLQSPETTAFDDRLPNFMH
ncbi:protein regulator of cytokinesis 1-like isoform X2 [Centruroides vittatus]|uniref:protein regulator of cytokinesis 1-like isoform X2 n=1 Tax=Centruroides vittatus TaxID=120091 RepID=UPI00350F3D12